MSLKRIVLISSANGSGGGGKENEATPRTPPVPSQGVNVVLGGAMMSGIIIMVFVICYCCHRNQQKRQNGVPRYWRDPALALEVYTVEGQQLFEMNEDVSQMVARHPPPSYETVVARDFEIKNETSFIGAETGRFDNDLPSYETALQLARNERTV